MMFWCFASRTQLSVGLVSFSQAAADPESSHRDRVECGVVSAVFIAALRALEPHALAGTHSHLQLLRALQTLAGSDRAG